MIDKKPLCLNEPCHSGISLMRTISLGPHSFLLAASNISTLAGPSEERSVPTGLATVPDITVLFSAFSANITTTTRWLRSNTSTRTPAAASARRAHPAQIRGRFESLALILPQPDRHIPSRRQASRAKQGSLSIIFRHFSRLRHPRHAAEL